MIRALCFDFDGTLASYAGEFELLLEELRVDLGLVACDFATFKRRVVAQLRRDGPLTLASALAAALDGLELRAPDDLEQVAQRAVASYAAGMQLKENARELLEALGDLTVPMALVTNGPVDMQRAAIASVAVEKHFRSVLISGDRDVVVRKPHPRIFDLACTGLASEPAQTLMIGDDVDNDISGALAYGMPAVLVGPPAIDGQGFERVDDLLQLGDLLRERITASHE